jgi:hypothetical protein
MVNKIRIIAKADVECGQNVLLELFFLGVTRSFRSYLCSPQCEKHAGGG